MAFSWTRNCLGLDLGSDSLRWVLLQGGWGSELLGTGSMPLNGDLNQSLLKLRGKLPAVPDRIVVAVPSRHFLFQSLDLPLKDPRKLQAALPFAMEEKLPRPIEGLEFEGFPREIGCLAVGVEPENLAGIRGELRAAGWSSLALEPALLAALRALPEGKDETSQVALVDLAAEHWSYALLENGEVQAAASLRGGLLAWARDLAKRFDLSLEQVRQRLAQQGIAGWPEARELLLSHFSMLRLAFWEASQQPLQLYLCGDGAGLPGMEAVFRELLPLESVEVLQPNGLKPELATAWGAAQRAVHSNAVHSLQLLSEQQGGAAFWTTARKRTVGALLFLILLLGGMDVFLQIRQRETQLRKLERQIESVYRGAVPEAVRIVNAPHQLKGKIQEIEQRLQLLPDPARDASHPLTFLATLSQAIPEDLKLDITSYTQSGSTLRLEGLVDDLESLSRLQTILGKLEAVESVNSGSSRRTVGGRMGVDLTLQLQGGTEP